ncbi:MAG: hypothetical protein CMB64_05260 [Euryarchaeota archaeon]|nr:hypothetical protein [Euryarchaeota archaeon]
MIVFDLDQTVVNSAHRTPLDEFGKVDIPGYVEKQTENFIMQDELLPLASVMKEAYYRTFVVICTARQMTQFDYVFLEKNNLLFHEIFERGNVSEEISKLPDPIYKTKCLKKYKDINYTFYDDSDEVIKLFNTYPNVNMIDSKAINIRLAQS